MADNLCTWCVAVVGQMNSHIRIQYPDPEHGGPNLNESWGPGGRQHDAQYGRTHRKVELIQEALENDWRVELNGGYLIEPPVATWHGDPVCGMHLAEQVQMERDGRWVRMAQWRR